MPTVTKKAAKNTTAQDVENILKTGAKIEFVISDFDDLRSQTTALYFDGFGMRAYRAKSIYLVNVASHLMTDDDYKIEVKELENGSYRYDLSKKA